MADQPRNWDKELAEIDRLIAAQPAGGKPKAVAPRAEGASAPAPRETSGPPPAARVGNRERLSVWMKVALGAILAGAMLQWPYGHVCGLGLFGYLGALGAVVVSGLWAARSAWTRRMGWAHTIGIAVTMWGVGLIALQILPRIGYARIPAAWWCP